MKKPTSLLLWIIVLTGIAVMVGMGGCRNPFVRPNPPVANSNPVAPPRDDKAETSKMVVDYLTALQNGDYGAAYGMLSTDSQSRHSAASFEQLGKKGMPLYDLTKLTATVTGDSAKVVLQYLEDPGPHGFYLVRESRVWKIVYWGGIPGAPDPD